MFPTSSQRRYWTFENEEEITQLRIKHNHEFVMRHRYQIGLDVCMISAIVTHSNEFYFSICFRCFWFFFFCTFFRMRNVCSIFWRQSRNECYWKCTNCIWKSFVDVSIHRCQNVLWERHFTISNVSIYIIHQWIIIRKRFCEYFVSPTFFCRSQEHKFKSPFFFFSFSFACTVQRVPIYRVKLKNSTFPLINSLVISKVIEQRQWILFCQTNYCWCSNSTIIWPFTIHFDRLKVFWLT